MKVLHAIPGIPPRAGGPSRSVPGLCRVLSEAGVETWLLSFSRKDVLDDPRHIHFMTGTGYRYYSAQRTSRRALDSVIPDIVHVHGLWTPATHAMIVQVRRRGIPYVISTRGMLDPWALKQKRGKKILAGLLYQWRDIRKASLLHATARQEYENIRNQGFSQPVAVIPNGIDIPTMLPARLPRAGGLRTALFLSRLHPGKGLLDLVAAWSRVKPRDWTMRVVGPDVCGHQAKVQAEIDRLGLSRDFMFVGEKIDADKWQEYANADLFVHPSYSENFGISIAEALAAGLPVITTKGTPWSELLGSSDSSLVRKCGSSKVEPEVLAAIVDSGMQSCQSCDLYARAAGNLVKTSHVPPNPRTSEPSNTRTSRCGWWIDIGVEPLAEALREAMSLSDEERRAMGDSGRQLVETKYTWPAIAERMTAVYHWALHGKTPPSCVRTG